jgi:hypothetical protein
MSPKLWLSIANQTCLVTYKATNYQNNEALKSLVVGFPEVPNKLAPLLLNALHDICLVRLNMAAITKLFIYGNGANFLQNIASSTNNLAVYLAVY